MIRVALCLAREHDLRLVMLAVLVCAVGSCATTQLFARIRASGGSSRAGWIALTAVGTGAMVWSTHFVAMLAFRASVPVVLDPVLTLVSLVTAIVLTVPGLALAASERVRGAPAAGGALIGFGIAAMHYTGMAAYRVDGIVSWAWGFVAASIAVAALLGALACSVLARGETLRLRATAAALLALAVAALHFTGMAAITIVPLGVSGAGAGLSDLTMTVMAMSSAFAGLLVIGCAAISALIDGHTQADTVRRLRRMALHDSLTDLPNRISFNHEFHQRLAALPGTDSQLAVVMLDLARFKAINDTYGHQAGDQLLLALAVRFQQLLRDGECIARLGGDEFAALKTFRTRPELDEFLVRVRTAVDRPMVFDRFTARMDAGIGVAVAPENGLDGDLLLADADLAMYRAKAAHAAAPCFYEPQMDQAERYRRELGNQLRAAIGSSQFELHYQVQASLATGAVTGYEALLRWNHPAEGIIMPAVFIPLAEEMGEIVRLSDWALRRACQDAMTWPEPYQVAVNLSPLQLSGNALVENVRAALADSGLPAARLELELTESAIIEDRQHALDQLMRIRAMGVAIALDDFGIGYSSLDVLRSFPFDRIKLDASFVAEVDRSDQAVAILRSVAALGATLGMPVLAEGIEAPAQLQIVAREGCAEVQGYLLGVPARELVDPARLAQRMKLVTAPSEALVLVA